MKFKTSPEKNHKFVKNVLSWKLSNLFLLVLIDSIWKRNMF